MGYRKDLGDPDFEDMTPFEQWFCGGGAYADGDLAKDADGNYVMPMTQEFYECWKATQWAESH